MFARLRYRIQRWLGEVSRKVHTISATSAASFAVSFPIWYVTPITIEDNKFATRKSAVDYFYNKHNHFAGTLRELRERNSGNIGDVVIFANLYQAIRNIVNNNYPGYDASIDIPLNELKERLNNILKDKSIQAGERRNCLINFYNLVYDVYQTDQWLEKLLSEFIHFRHLKVNPILEKPEFKKNFFEQAYSSMGPDEISRVKEHMAMWEIKDHRFFSTESSPKTYGSDASSTVDKAIQTRE